MGFHKTLWQGTVGNSGRLCQLDHLYLPYFFLPFFQYVQIRALGRQVFLCVFRHILLTLTCVVSQPLAPALFQVMLITLRNSKVWWRRRVGLVWEAALGLVMDQLKLHFSNAIFLSLFIYCRSAAELFETYCMKAMTFNPPVESVTPRRKVLFSSPSALF